jgi:polyferredoxin
MAACLFCATFMRSTCSGDKPVSFIAFAIINPLTFFSPPVRRFWCRFWCPGGRRR